MKLIASLKGYQPISFVQDRILLAKGYDLYLADLECKYCQYIGSVPQTLGVKIASWSRTLERCLRLGIRYGCEISKSRILLAERRRIWKLDLHANSIELDHEIEQGARPLAINYVQGIKGFDDGAYFGEYWDNLGKGPVNIWARKEDDRWSVVHTFTEGTINHIHALIPDKNRGVVWILTGDFDRAPGIWAARDNFSSVTPVLAGEQEYRCCWLAFWGNRVVYATDSPLSLNSVREMIFADEVSHPAQSPVGLRSEPLLDTAGSSIYSCMVQDRLVFSTAVEPGMPSGVLIRDMFERKPGPGIRDHCAYLIAGTAERGFSVIGSWAKDRLPPRLCEFGTIKFPVGVNPGPFLYAYFVGLSGMDGSMSVFEMDE